jgi:hypothetical protein
MLPNRYDVQRHAPARPPSATFGKHGPLSARHSNRARRLLCADAQPREEDIAAPLDVSRPPIDTRRPAACRNTSQP